MKPKVSVVMNCLQNQPDWLVVAVDSLLDNRDTVDLQLIISTVRGDPSIALAKARGLEFVTTYRPSIYRQLNAALPLVTGDYFCCVAGNDKTLPDRFIREVSVLEINEGKKVVYTAFSIADEDLNITGVNRYRPTYSYSAHLKGNYMADDSLMRREILDRYAPFRQEYGNYAYYDFWLRVAEGEGNVFVYYPEPTWIYRISKTSRHIRKKTDTELRALDVRDRAKMLAAHWC